VTAFDSASSGEPEAGRARGGPVREFELGGPVRATATVLGSALLYGGLRRRSLVGVAEAVAGGALLYGGVSGRNPLGSFGRGGEAGSRGRGATVERTVTVNEPPEALSEYWRDAEQLSRIVGEVAEVTREEGNRYRWEVTGPRGRTLLWRTRIMLDRPGEVLRWRSVGDAPITNEWTVRFRPAPGNRGTEVTLAVDVDPPGGRVGRAIARRFVPESLVWKALQRFKRLAETGEIPTPNSSPSGEGEGDLV
jgi:uncharacterized membrane protein